MAKRWNGHLHKNGQKVHKIVLVFLKKLKIELSYDPEVTRLSVYFHNTKTLI